MRSFVLLLAKLLLAVTVIAQQKPKTIYDVLGAPYKKCPIDTTNTDDVSLGVVEGLADNGSTHKAPPAFDINTYAPVLGQSLGQVSTTGKPEGIYTF